MRFLWIAINILVSSSAAVFDKEALEWYVYPQRFYAPCVQFGFVTLCGPSSLPIQTQRLLLRIINIDSNTHQTLQSHLAVVFQIYFICLSTYQLSKDWRGIECYINIIWSVDLSSTCSLLYPSDNFLCLFQAWNPRRPSGFLSTRMKKNYDEHEA